MTSEPETDAARTDKRPDLAEPLEELGTCLGLKPEDWRQGEGLSRIDFPANLPIPLRVIQACCEQIAAVAKAYGKALGKSALLGFAGVDDLLLGEDLTSAQVDEFAAALGSAVDDPNERDQLPVRMSLAIDKRRLLPRRLHASAADHRFELIFYRETLEGLLSVPTGKLDDWWSGIEEGRLVIFVPSWEHGLEGAHLAIVGGDLDAGIERFAPASLEERGESAQ